MSELSTLLIKKGSKTISTLAEYGYATKDIDYPIVTEVKDFASRNVPGEDGERVYFPDSASLEPYDLEVEFMYRGNVEANKNLFDGFRDFLTGRDKEGTELSIYSPYHRVGRQKVYAKKIEVNRFKRDGDEGFASFKVTFRVTDPVTDILLSV